MPLEINIKPEDVDELVKSAILKSAIGETIAATIKKVCNGYNNPIEEEVKKAVRNMAFALLNEKYTTQIREIVEKEIAARVTQGMLETVTNSTMKRLEKAMDDKY